MNAIAAIHVAKKQLGLDDDTYRDLLARLTGKRSTKDMSDQERDAVLGELRRQAPASKRLEGRFAKKLQALWIAGWNLGVVKERDDAALLAFVKRQTNVDHVRFLTDAAEALKAIEAIKSWLAREAGVSWTDDRSTPLWLRQPGAKIAMAQWSMLAKAGDVDPAFPAFVTFVQERAFRLLGQMSPAEWKGIMNTLGERVRKVRR